MRRRTSSSGVALAIVAGLIGAMLWIATSCGAPSDVEDQSSQGPFTLTIWNRTQFEVLEVRIHSARNGFTSVQNRLEAPLAVGEALEIPKFRSGDYVTFVRNKHAQGEKMAVRTDTGVSVDGHGHTLVLFDTSFRLLEPYSEDNPFGDAGPDRDAGFDVGRDASSSPDTGQDAGMDASEMTPASDAEDSDTSAMMPPPDGGGWDGSMQSPDDTGDSDTISMPLPDTGPSDTSMPLPPDGG